MKPSMKPSKNNDFSLKIDPAKLTWQNGNPYSEVFEDHFFAQEGGYEESKYVFLAQNDLPQRWKGLEKEKTPKNFVIGETGFGTGLNFLTTAEAWLAHSALDQQLHYLSIEKHPFQKSDLTQIYSKWENLKELGAELLARYPPMLGGFHRRYLFEDRIVLTLVFGDVVEVLPQISGKVDAWYLDGFAPSKNPQMWSEALFRD